MLMRLESSLQHYYNTYSRTVARVIQATILNRVAACSLFIAGAWLIPTYNGQYVSISTLPFYRRDVLPFSMTNLW